MSDEPKLNRVDGIVLCDLCLDGKGGVCHVPGCLFWINSTPDIPIRQAIIDRGGTIVPLPNESDHVSAFDGEIHQIISEVFHGQ